MMPKDKAEDMQIDQKLAKDTQRWAKIAKMVENSRGYSSSIILDDNENHQYIFDAE
jgi:hypothetical protein